MSPLHAEAELGSTRVVVVDDHEMFLQSLVRLLRDEPGITVVETAATAADALRAVRRARPDVVVMDQALPDGQGTAAARTLVGELPDTKVLLLTGNVDAETVVAALDSGCAACLEKTKAFDELVAAVRAVQAGERIMPSEQLAAIPRLNELVLRYQAVVDLGTQRVAGFEELVRWQHPRRGLLGPDEFLGAVEGTDLMVDIGAWVLNEACSEWASWDADTGPLALSVNLSARELCDLGLPRRLAAALTNSGLDPTSLVLEATERDLLEDSEDVRFALYRLRDLGVRLSLDDFGTGFSSMAYLRRFPVDIIKIDKSFVDGLPDTERSRFLVASICDLAEKLGMSVVAEGIERAAQAEALRTLGCGLGQGYHFSRPVDGAAAAAQLERGDL